MKRAQFIFSCFVLAALVLPTTLFFNIPRAQAETNPNCELSWELVPAPSFPGNSPVLNLVAHSAPDDVWAAGLLITSQPGTVLYRPLFMHWDGAHWSEVAPPNFDGTKTFLQGLTAVSPTGAWAVGTNYDGTPYGVILYWNGTTWSEVPVPDGWAGNLASIDHASANHVWAVGDTGSSPALLFWDGIEWLNHSDQVATLGFTGLTNVSALGVNNVYVAGPLTQDNKYYAGIAHWDGVEWILTAKILVYANNPQYVTESIEGMVALSPNDLWLALQVVGPDPLYTEYLIVRWNGVLWETIDSKRDFVSGLVYDLQGSAPNNVYGLVGGINGADGRHWDGTDWHAFSLPLPKANDSPFHTVGIISENEAWIVGGKYNAPNKHQPYIAHGTSPCALPPRPKLLSPDQDQILQRTDPTLKWIFTPGAIYFEIIFRQMHTPDRPVTRETLTRSKFKPPMVLNRGKSHRWRVRACNDNGCGKWSKARTFKVAETEQ